MVSMNLAPFHAYTGRGESGKEPVCKIAEFNLQMQQNSD